MVRENVDSIIDRIRDFREAGAHFFQLNLLHGIHLLPAYFCKKKFNIHTRLNISL